MNRMLRFTLGAVLGGLPLLSVSAASAAVAANRIETQVTVRYGDLDLATPHGAQLMYERLGHAARNACGEQDLPYLESWHNVRTCTQDAVHQAVQQLGQNELTNVYLAHAANR